MPEESEIEIRQVFEAEDFGPAQSESEHKAFMDECFAYHGELRKNGHIVGGKRSKLRGTPSPWGPPPGPYRSLCFSKAGDAGKSILIMNVHPSVS
jgi:hypothetical protein